MRDLKANMEDLNNPEYLKSFAEALKAEAERMEAAAKRIEDSGEPLIKSTTTPESASDTFTYIADFCNWFTGNCFRCSPC
ncbi:hypothetical protein [Leptodesmis sichuanensis]|uniref:hypothetical protein n=1 Tax=Leptodesmis sichuanensis TaxID=2906798 RepID=UPI001F44E272|nr:hypothetical protein [Leptodesmis sichuanensis]UIE38405.1 hypothetical protein KIK02_01730 [Leptodesmis sichuanensis A121]